MMGVAAATGTPTRRGFPKVIVTAVATAWVVAIAADLSGAGDLLHHDALIEGALPLVGGLALFVLAWQLTIVAMMLPSSLPLVRMFRVVSEHQAHPSQAVTGLLVGYAGVWTGFGIAAFLVDVGVHRAVDSVPWLVARPHLIGASAMLLAGAFQFSELKDRCLRECRHPGPFLFARYERGVGPALRLGISHALFCLGCCWALMLIGFAAGVANLWWMAALTAVMVYEKTGRHGDRIVAPVGLALIAAGLLRLL